MDSFRFIRSASPIFIAIRGRFIKFRGRNSELFQQLLEHFVWMIFECIQFSGLPSKQPERCNSVISIFCQRLYQSNPTMLFIHLILFFASFSLDSKASKMFTFRRERGKKECVNENMQFLWEKKRKFRACQAEEKSVFIYCTVKSNMQRIRAIFPVSLVLYLVFDAVHRQYSSRLRCLRLHFSLK